MRSVIGVDKASLVPLDPLHEWLPTSLVFALGLLLCFLSGGTERHRGVKVPTSPSCPQRGHAVAS